MVCSLVDVNVENSFIISAEVGEWPWLSLSWVVAFLASQVHGIGEVEAGSRKIELPDLVVSGGVVGLMAASNLSDSP